MSLLIKDNKSFAFPLFLFQSRAFYHLQLAPEIHMVDFDEVNSFIIITVVLNDINVGGSQVTFLPANSRHFLEQHADRNFPVCHRFSFKLLICILGPIVNV